MALLSCTECGYCLPCPAGILIPDVFSIYNMAETEGTAAAAERYRMLEVKADTCIRCGRCEKICPQHIGISAMMLDIAETFEEYDG